MTNKINYSDYQKEIFKNVAKEKGHLIVEALAGSGKTTTLVESFKFVPKGAKTIVFAFNKIIQKELESRSPSYVLTRTFHGCGLMAIKQKFGQSIEINEYKINDIIKKIDNFESDLVDSLRACVDQCRNFLVDHPTGIENLINQFGIDTCDMEISEFTSLVIKILAQDKLMTNEIDFTDMCYFPFIFNLNLGKYQYVFTDEYQDANLSNLWMAKKACDPLNGRMIIFGDKLQNLYSWRGSNSSLVEELKDIESTKILKLPISYRCPTKVIALAKNWAKDILAAPGAKEGEITNISLNKLYSDIKPGCFILSRTNAPLVKICMQLIRSGIRANIRGRDVGKQLNFLIKKSKKKQVPAFLKWLDDWKEKEVKKLIAKGIKIDNILDRVECLTNLCDEFKTLEEVKVKIDAMFNDTDEKNIVILSSVHRAKGLERDIVYILRWTFRAWLDNVPEEITENEEFNIAYVAGSRSRDKLFIVNKF